MFNFKIFTASNGQEACNIASNNLYNDILDVILLDLEMPIINGYEACQNIMKLYNNNKFNHNIININNVDENKLMN